MQTILITGGAGFIGSHTSLNLLEIGYKVIILDSFIKSSPKSLERIKKFIAKNKPGSENKLEIIKGDIRNTNILKKIFEKALKDNNKIDAVIHFAGLKSVPESFLKKSIYWDINVNGTISLLKIMDEFNCKCLVFSSSAAVYSPELAENILEDSMLMPNSPYGKTKLAAENLISDLFNSSSNWNVIILRYFNPIGAHPAGILGESPIEKPTNIFPYLLQVASLQRRNLNIYGKDWPTLDGTTVRDYIHISDLVEGHVKSLKFLLASPGNFIHINLGLGEGTSILDLINSFEKTNNLEIPYVYKGKRIGDIAIRIASNKLASEILHWKPEKNISQMCIDGWKWQKLNPKGY